MSPLSCYITFLLLIGQLSYVLSQYIPNTSENFLLTASNSGSRISKEKIQYGGGTIISKIKVFVVFWGGLNNVIHADRYIKFYKDLVDSPYFDWIADEYSTKSQTIQKGDFIGYYSYQNAPQGNVSDKTIQTTLANLINYGDIPSPDDNTYFAIHFTPNTTINVFNVKSCAVGGFCSYHSSIKVGRVIYGVMPDFSGSCLQMCGKGTSWDIGTSAASHEFLEVITNPFFFELAWGEINGNSIQELADNCNQEQYLYQTNNGMQYTLQKMWSNKYESCYVTSPNNITNSMPTQINNEILQVNAAKVVSLDLLIFFLAFGAGFFITIV
ncbi:hypothetical protein BC833DRAFT_565201 [Globomyces pollinis-pini]|nr:hypothetical protein BC833DRAFT_565201 [Globomyces pollinis-pini]